MNDYTADAIRNAQHNAQRYACQNCSKYPTCNSHLKQN